MSHEGGLAMLVATFIAFGVVTISLYFLVLRPILPNDGAADTTRAAGTRIGASNNGPNHRGHAATNRRATGAATAATTVSSTGSSSIDKVLAECARVPIHVAPASSQSSSSTAGRANLLVEGLLAFRHSRASSYEQSQGGGATATAQNRKERARILSRMLALEKSSAGAGNPPIRGSTIVVSTPLAEVACPKLRRVLFLLSTYYNLLLILVMPSGTTLCDVEKATKQLRGMGEDGDRLEADCLPDHRIVASSSATGRIAFVRQLGKVEVVVDFDTEVKTQLSRFGYRVINYRKQLSDKTASQLGNQLLS